MIKIIFFVVLVLLLAFFILNIIMLIQYIIYYKEAMNNGMNQRGAKHYAENKLNKKYKIRK